MLNTPNLKMPYLAAAQAQKHVTHNEALRMLDAIVQLSVVDRDLAEPPAEPGDGHRFIVADNATGDWAGRDGQVAAWQDGAYMYYQPESGWIAWLEDEDKLIVWDGAEWTDVTTAGSSNGGGGGSTSVNPTPLVGVNATADTNNRLSVSSGGTLFNHDGADHRQVINKANSADTASQIYQTGFSGRAEIGLTGNDDLHVKVSTDGATWHDGMIVDGQTGAVTLPNTSLAFSKSARVVQTAPVTVSPAGTLMPWQTIDYDTGGFFSPSQPNRFTIPANINQVMLFGYVQINSSAQGGGNPGIAYVEIRHKDLNGTLKQTLYHGASRTGGVFEGAPIVPAPLAVDEGDYFEAWPRALAIAAPAYSQGINYFAIAAVA